MDRAQRRHHRERIWKKRRRYYGGDFDVQEGWMADDPRKRMVINTPALCSTCCSKNFERRMFGRVTRKEKLAEISQQEQLVEYRQDKRVA